MIDSSIRDVASQTVRLPNLASVIKEHLLIYVLQISDSSPSLFVNMSLPTTMKAVIFDGPYNVSVQDRPVPQCASVPDNDIPQ